MSDNKTGAPFPPSCALNKELLGPLPSESQDFPQPQNGAANIQHIPGNPSVGLYLSEVHHHLSNDLTTPLLDELYPHLWLVSKKSGSHIDALHVQRVKRRSIVPTEDPRLHLVWSQDKIYIKPVPLFLLNHGFWVQYLQRLKRDSATEDSLSVPEQTASMSIRSIALGFMRSYASLVKSPLDFAIARESYLIPSDIDWIQWSVFINHFRDIGDDRVAKRYHYGQLRLSRLNWAVRMFRPKHSHATWFYENSYWSTSEFLARATFPLVFLFAGVSLALSSMQVALSVPMDRLWPQIMDEHELRHMNRAFWLFSIAVAILWLVIWILLLGIPIVVLCSQVLWGFRNRQEKHAINSSTV